MDTQIAISEGSIKDRIYTIRAKQVMLDQDLAELYGVSTGAINQAVKRNLARFPQNFMFQITGDEIKILKSQFVISSWGGRRSLPHVFTEHGIIALSGVLKSTKAIEINTQIVEAFVSMRKFIQKNAGIFQRLNTVERKQLQFDEQFEKVFNIIEDRTINKNQGIFFDGQIFDAYEFISDLIRSAKKSIVLIDNYIDDSVLTLFSKREKGVQVNIYTNKISKQLKLDLEKYNSQYPFINVKVFKDSHDRFLILDDKEVYHIGASLKDLGKKWFAFSKFEKGAIRILELLELK